MSTLDILNKLTPSNPNEYKTIIINPEKQVYAGKTSKHLPFMLVKHISDKPSKNFRHFRIENNIKFQANEADKPDIYTLIECVTDSELIQQCFVDVLLVIMEGTNMSESLEIITELFKGLDQPNAQETQGVFGELFYIEQSKSSEVVGLWCTNPKAPFDFESPEIKLDIKTTQTEIIEVSGRQARECTEIVVYQVEKGKGQTVSQLYQQICKWVTNTAKIKATIISKLGPEWEKNTDTYRITNETHLDPKQLQIPILSKCIIQERYSIDIRSL